MCNNIVTKCLLRPLFERTPPGRSLFATPHGVRVMNIRKHLLYPSFGSRSYTTQRRRISSTTRPKPRNPLLIAVLAITTVAAGSFIGLKVYDRYYGRKSPFPLEVEEKLRQAIHHSEIAREPELSFQEFQEALQLAESNGMSKRSAEYMGIRIRTIEMLEKYGLFRVALPLYCDFAYEALQYAMEDMARIGLVPAEMVAKVPARTRQPKGATIEDFLEFNESGMPSLGEFQALQIELIKKLQTGERPIFEADVASRHPERLRVYSNLLGVLNNLAMFLYTANDKREAVTVYTTLVGWYSILRASLAPFGDATLLSRRQEAAVWDSSSTALFESKVPGRFHTSAQQWSLALKRFREMNEGQPTCEEVTLLSNLAVSRIGYSSTYGQDLPDIVDPSDTSPTAQFFRSSPDFGNTPSPGFEIPFNGDLNDKTTFQLSSSDFEREAADALANGRELAMTAIKLSQHIKPPTRTEECDLGCLAALEHLSLFAKLAGNPKIAKERLVEAKKLAQKLNAPDYRSTVLEELNPDPKPRPNTHPNSLSSYLGAGVGPRGAGVIDNALHRMRPSSSRRNSDDGNNNNSEQKRIDLDVDLFRHSPATTMVNALTKSEERAEVIRKARSNFLSASIKRYDRMVKDLDREIVGEDDKTGQDPDRKET